MPCHGGSAVEQSRRPWSPPNELGASSAALPLASTLSSSNRGEAPVGGAADSGAAPEARLARRVTASLSGRACADLVSLLSGLSLVADSVRDKGNSPRS